MATLLYTANVELTVSSAIATWKAPPGSVLPLDPSRPSTAVLLLAGDITLAPDGSHDTATPAAIVRGQPGLHKTVSN